MDYKTENLYLASALLTAGKKLIESQRNGNGKVIFLFDDSDGDIQELVSKYFSSELCLPISSFVNNWRNLRRLIDTV